MFREVIRNYLWDQAHDSIYRKTPRDVEWALSREKRDLEDFKALISPAALPYLEQMAIQSHQITRKRFGKTMQLFIPLYVSNLCENHCVYCGFNQTHPIKRVILTDEQVLREVEVLKSYGYEHVLLVSGEAPKKAGIDYFQHMIRLIKPWFSLISLEVQPLEQKEYEQLIKEGLHTVYIYQETYHPERYRQYHLKGKKSDYTYRLDTPDRLGRAGIHRIGLGSLIGLEDWRTDAFFTALHLKYLEKQFWKTRYSISFPRLRPHQGMFQPNCVMTDRELVQLICAYRLLDENVELSLSVRESRKFRDHMVKLGITSMSAGSRTDPGGYASGLGALEQFEVHDNRTPQEVVEMIRAQGYEAVWKDWDICMLAE